MSRASTSGLPPGGSAAMLRQLRVRAGKSRRTPSASDSSPSRDRDRLRRRFSGREPPPPPPPPPTARTVPLSGQLAPGGRASLRTAAAAGAAASAPNAVAGKVTPKAVTRPLRGSATVTTLDPGGTWTGPSRRPGPSAAVSEGSAPSGAAHPARVARASGCRWAP